MGDVLRRHWPLWCALTLVVVGRVVMQGWPISPDESGFFLVADDLLHHGGDGIYGHYWVDRPPGLIWIFTLAAACGSVEAIRWIVAVFLLGFVVASYAAARLLVGADARGAVGAAVAVAAAFAVTPAVGSMVGNGEAFAIPFVMGSIALLLRAERTDGRAALWLCGAAGLTGVLAFSVKQNFVESLVFALVVLVVSGLRGERRWADVVRRGGAGLVGMLVACAGFAAWAATTGAGVAGLWQASVTFRIEATGVLRSTPNDSIDERLAGLIDNAWRSGIVPLVLALLVVAVASRLRGSATAWGAAAVIVVEIAGVAVGGQFWTHYLLGLGPGLVLGTALAFGSAQASPSAAHEPVARRHPRWTRPLLLLVVAYVVGSAAVMVPVKAHESAGWGTPSQTHVGGYVADSARPGDTATVLYGRADYQRETGLRSPYRHLWSLPVRVLDPDLEELQELLAGPDAPVWLVQVFAIDSWGLDPDGDAAALVKQRYRRVLDDCGAYVYLLRSVQRDLAPAPDC